MDFLLRKAIEEATPLKIIYIDRQTRLSERVITIESINATHVRAYCQTKRGIRMFRRENILSAGMIRNRKFGA
ncbi:putative DNA-binding transcriptional regulator YafY [Rossellomorea marisflavi]